MTGSFYTPNKNKFRLIWVGFYKVRKTVRCMDKRSFGWCTQHPRWNGKIALHPNTIKTQFFVRAPLLRLLCRFFSSDAASSSSSSSVIFVFLFRFLCWCSLIVSLPPLVLVPLPLSPLVLVALRLPLCIDAVPLGKA